MSLRFLVVEGNIRSIREAYREGQGVTPAQGYGNVLVQVAGGGSYDIVQPADADAALPPGRVDERTRDAIRILALHLWKGEPEALRQVELARAIYRAKVPFFGSCWGLQVAATAAGGRVHRNPRGREMGFARKIVPNVAGRAHPLLAGRPAAFDAPCSHLDEVAELPPDATLLASNAVSRVQAAEFRYEGGTFWGIQYHPEYSLADMAYLVDRRVSSLVEEGFFADEAGKNAYVADLRALHREPAPSDVAFRHGLGPDVTDPAQRLTEIRNFIEARVRPEAARRGRAG